MSRQRQRAWSSAARHHDVTGRSSQVGAASAAGLSQRSVVQAVEMSAVQLAITRLCDHLGNAIRVGLLYRDLTPDEHSADTILAIVFTV